MKKYSAVIVMILLLALSSIIYFVQLAQFHSPRDTLFYLMQDLAFLPVQIALVTIVIGKIIGTREKRERLNRTNMMVNAFFSEIGIDLMRQLLLCGGIAEELAPYLNIKSEWSSKDFLAAANSVKKQNINVDCTLKNLTDIKELLKEKRMLILVMLSNPALLEHEAFTDMLWAVFHLTDELLARNSLDDLPEADISHLNNDVKRALGAILIHWIGYMNHIKTDYPYLFSIEMRRSPVNRDAGIVVR